MTRIERSGKLALQDVAIPKTLYDQIKNAADVRSGNSIRSFVRNAVEASLHIKPAPILAICHAGAPDIHDVDEGDLIRCSEIAGGERYGYVEVEGFSMSNQIPDGALAHIHLNAPYKEGSVVSCWINGSGNGMSALKQVSIEEPWIMVLKSDPRPDYGSHPNIYVYNQDDTHSRGAVPDGSLAVSSAEITIVGVWTGSYIYSQKRLRGKK